MGHYAQNFPFTESKGMEDKEVTEVMSNLKVDDDAYLTYSDSDDILFLQTECLMSTKLIEDLTTHKIV